MPRSDWQSPLPVETFSTHLNAALNASAIPDLSLLIPATATQSGESHWEQSYRPKGAFGEESGAWVQEAAKARPAGATPRRNWEATAAADQTFANWLLRMTPHQDVDFYMTLIDKQFVETGHEFESRDKLDMNLDPTSAVIKTLAQSFIVNRNKRVIDALTATSATRKMLDMKYYTEGTTKNPNFGKVVQKTENWSDNNQYSAYTSVNSGYLSITDDLPVLEAQLEACNVPHDMRKIVLLNPFDAGNIKTKNFDKLYSRDFPFASASDLKSGQLPEMFGFSFVKTNLLAKGTMIAFVPDAVRRVPYKPLEQTLGYSIDYRNAIKFYAREEWGIGRIDDLGAIKITIKA